jgi:hypothetical protein
MQGRKAKRDEDYVYSLLGLFDIQMPLLYGEGREKAFARLEREIALQQPFQEAPRQRLSSTRHLQHLATTTSDEQYGSSTPQDNRPRSPQGYTPSRGDTSTPENNCSTTQGKGIYFNAYGGTQNNNWANGYQFNGSLFKPRFNSGRRRRSESSQRR